MMAAPLILGNDLTNMTDSVFDIITNKDVIAIDQDSLGVQGLRYLVEDGLEFWFKPLVDGRWAFTVFNRGGKDTSYKLDWQKFNFTDDLSERSTAFDSIVYNVHDVWGNGPKKLKTTAKGATVDIAADDVVTFILTPAK